MKAKFLLIFLVGLALWLAATSYESIHAYFNKSADPIVEQEHESETVDNLVHDNPEVEKSQPGEKVVNIAESGDTSLEEENGKESALEETTTVAESSEEILDHNAASKEDAIQEEAPSTNPETPNNSSITSNLPNTAIYPHMWMSQLHSYPNWVANPWAMYSMNNMLNPYFWMQQFMTPMMNPMVDAMTQEQSMNAMMRSMDPRLVFAMFGTHKPNYDGDSSEVPDQLPVATIPGFPTQSHDNWPKNTVSESVSREAKMNAFQTAMAMSPLSMRNMVSMMANKIPVDEDVTWDDAVEAMKLRANEVNFKFVGSSPLWKQIEAETEEPSAKVEMFRFCDARMARKILDEVPEFIIFLPCKIALLEDSEGKLWVMTLDWDVSWLDYAQNPNNHLPKEIREGAKRIRKNIQYIMEGAATGDF